jgi:membrane protease YdiL (CAAX protease family)
MGISRRVASFLLLAFGSTWAIAGIGAYAGIRAASGLSYVLLAAACMLMPALSAMVQQRLIDRAPWSGLGLSFHGMNWKALALTALVGVAIVPTALFVLYLMGDVLGLDAFGHASVTSEHMLAALTEALQRSGKGAMSSTVVDAMTGVPACVVLMLGLLLAVVAACTANLPFMLGEELGWRGYLYQATSAWSGGKRVLFTGTIWGLWHAPLILMGHNYPEYPVAGMGMMVVFCTLLAFLFDWSRTRVNAVWGPCVLHGIINGSAGLFALFAWEGHPLVASPVGAGGFIALAVLAVAVFAMDRAYRHAFTQ